MLKTVTTTFFIGFVALVAFVVFVEYTHRGESVRFGERSGGACTDIPQFSEYPAPPEKAFARSLSVDFDSDSRARTFQSSIEEWFGKGPQAGRYYTVAEWGCGTACQDHAIIDMRDGRITAFGLPGSDGMMYRTDSNLIIVNPPWNLEAAPVREATTSALFYELKDGVPRLICSKIYPPKK